MTWSGVPAIDRNGIITQYEVVYEPLETFGGQLVTRTNMTDNSTLEVLLENLQEYVQYNIRVRAYTETGEGPFSSAIIISTLEAGKCRLLVSKCALKEFTSIIIIGFLYSSIQSP